jgi:hypothetical protein
MRTITQTLYTYVTSTNGDDAKFRISDTSGMEGEGWLLVDTREISIEVEDVDYSGLIKQKKLDAALAKQEAIAAELLELTSNEA